MDSIIPNRSLDPAALDAVSQSLGADPDEIGNALVLDVRRAAAYAQACTTIPGARWFDPASVATWSPTLPTAHDVVVYCVHGHEVSQITAMRLRAAGLNARYLRGGIDGWQAAGRPLAEKPSAQKP